MAIVTKKIKMLYNSGSIHPSPESAPTLKASFLVIPLSRPTTCIKPKMIVTTIMMIIICQKFIFVFSILRTNIRFICVLLFFLKKINHFVVTFCLFMVLRGVNIKQITFFKLLDYEKVKF